MTATAHEHEVERLVTLIKIYADSGDMTTAATVYERVQTLLITIDGWKIWRDTLRHFYGHGIEAAAELFDLALYFVQRLNEAWPARQTTTADLARHWARLCEVMPWE